MSEPTHGPLPGKPPVPGRSNPLGRPQATKTHLDLTANPTPAERRTLIREDLTIAAIPVEGAAGGFHGIVVPQQAVTADQVMVGAVICRHWHGTLTAALTCANRLANEMKARS